LKIKTREFNKGAAVAIRDEKVQKSLLGLYNGFHKARISAAADTPDWELLRERARQVKNRTIANLDHYLEQFEKKVTELGGIVYFATDAEAASKYVLDLAKERGVRTVIKGKSMISEEMGLNEQLTEAGIEPVETDLGEYVIQLAGETPYHIVAPAIHKDRHDVSKLFQEKLGTPHIEDIEGLGKEAREQLRGKFIVADMGITGANFLVAETGTLGLVTNEGNGRMASSMPRIHLALAGMERVVPTMEDMSMFLRLLIRSATGQRISSYVTLVNGLRRPADEDGPEEFHIVIVDNGRSRMLADPELREALNCIRCGACLNACPVYRKVGGHSYGYVYPGPIGAIVTPMLTGLGDAKDLPFASSLCGACKEACPVKVNIPRMLLALRRDLTDGKKYPADKRSTLAERLSFKAWRVLFGSNALLGLSVRIGRLMQVPLVRNGAIRWLPGPLSGWTRHRTLKPLPSSSFRDRWADHLKDADSSGRRE
jgi:L-lactate dehydrogenase complex protein LldF